MIKKMAIYFYVKIKLLEFYLIMFNSCMLVNASKNVSGH